MKVIASFAGKNRDFKAWLAAQRYPGKVVSLAEWRRSRNKKAATAWRRRRLKFKKKAGAAQGID